MKTKWISGLLRAACMAGLVVALTSCPPTVTKTVYSPEYLSFADLRKSIEPSPARSLTDTGKIYVLDTYVFVNEYHEGVHVIDNSTPSSPQVVAFIPIPGNVDIAIKDGILYADSYVDLVALQLNLSPQFSVTEVARIPDAFAYPYMLPWLDDMYRYDGIYEDIDPDQGVVVGWSASGTQTVSSGWSGYGYDIMLMESGAPTASTGTGTGGSMARFTIVDTYLYALHEGAIQVFGIADPAAPAKYCNIALDWDIETIFPLQDKLFIGSQTGMYIYNVADPSNPTRISEFTHAKSCDPVVAQGNFAYVTLRSGGMCGETSNVLEVIDITDIANPTLIPEATRAMQGPYGLGIDGSVLFVCDGEAGLKVYNVADPSAPDEIRWISGFLTYDVIMAYPIAIVVGPDGLYQYDYSNAIAAPSSISLVSTLSIGEP